MRKNIVTKILTAYILFAMLFLISKLKELKTQKSMSKNHSYFILDMEVWLFVIWKTYIYKNAFFSCRGNWKVKEKILQFFNLQYKFDINSINLSMKCNVRLKIGTNIFLGWVRLGQKFYILCLCENKAVKRKIL